MVLAQKHTWINGTELGTQDCAQKKKKHLINTEDSVLVTVGSVVERGSKLTKGVNLYSDG